jgi:hypothetical protein
MSGSFLLNRANIFVQFLYNRPVIVPYLGIVAERSFNNLRCINMGNVLRSRLAPPYFQALTSPKNLNRVPKCFNSILEEGRVCLKCYQILPFTPCAHIRLIQGFLLHYFRHRPRVLPDLVSLHRCCLESARKEMRFLFSSLLFS